MLFLFIVIFVCVFVSQVPMLQNFNLSIMSC